MPAPRPAITRTMRAMYAGICHDGRPDDSAAGAVDRRGTVVGLGAAACGVQAGLGAVVVAGGWGIGGGGASGDAAGGTYVRRSGGSAASTTGFGSRYWAGSVGDGAVMKGVIDGVSRPLWRVASSLDAAA